MHDIRQFYTERINILSEEITLLKGNSKKMTIWLLLSFSVMVFFIIAYFAWNGGILSLVMAAVFFGVYLFMRNKDTFYVESAEKKTKTLKVYQNELSYLNGDFSCFSSGEQYIDPHHEFTLDLDIFGPQSLFHRINRTATTGGSDFLASELADTRVRTIAKIQERRDAIRELAEREDLRTKYLTTSIGQTINTARILEVLHDVQKTNIPRLTLSLLSFIPICCSLILFYSLIILSLFGSVSAEAPMTWGVFQLIIVYLFSSRSLNRASSPIQKIHSQLSIYISLIRQIADSGLESKELRDIIFQLSNGRTDAVKSFDQLHGIFCTLGMRNELWVFVSNTFFCGDYFMVRKFLKWQDQNMMRMDEWIAAVSHFDALVSMATFRCNEPQATDAELIESDKVIYEAKGIYHPFLVRKAVRNDFSIADKNFYIITGANMAGKSTFLRSLGINYVLATCGLPVFADSLRISLYSLFSSMRTTDDLAHGISYFNAELLRLQQLIKTCKRNKQTLIILDEILKGTNSLDKLNGSRLFLQSVASLPVTGIVATHDLELSKMQQEYPERFHNYCFEIQLSDEVTYTYKITKGVARNQNATYLLNNILKTI